MPTKHLNYGHSVQATGFFSFPKAVTDPLYSPSQWISEPTKTWLESFFEKKNSICIDQSAIENSSILLKCATDLQPLNVLCTHTVRECTIVWFLQSRGCSSAFWVMSVFGSREEEVMMTPYKSFVRSQLNYSSLLWHVQKIGDIEVIEGVQRAFKSRISAVSQFDYWERLRKLKLMSLQRHKERFIIIWMH